MSAVVVLSPDELRDLVAEAVRMALRSVDHKPLPVWMKSSTAARRLGVSPSTIYRRAIRGDIPADSWRMEGDRMQIATAWVLANEVSACA